MPAEIWAVASSNTSPSDPDDNEGVLADGRPMGNVYNDDPRSMTSVRVSVLGEGKVRSAERGGTAGVDVDVDMLLIC